MRWAEVVKSIELMMEKSGAWLAPLEEIAAHVKKCTDDGFYTRPIDNLPYYAERISVMPLGEAGRKAATVFVNARKGRALRLRGVYARVVEDGRVTAGDRVVKVG